VIFDVIRRRPLFFAAVCFSVVILVQSQFPEKLSPHEISLQIGKSSEPIFLNGIITSEVDARDTVYGDRLVSFVLKAKDIFKEENSRPFMATGNVKVYLRNPNKDLSYGDEVSMKGDLRLPKGVRNPGGFDQKAYLGRRGIRALFYGDHHVEPEILSRHRGNYFRERMIAVKHFLSQSLSATFNKRDAGFLKALFLGERSDLSEDFKTLFIRTGTMHILAVSGFNIGFLSLSFFFFLRPFKVSRNLKLLLTLVLVWLYCFLVGWQSPVVRASVMATILISGQLLGRKPNLLNSLGLAALVILGINPKQLFDVGFQLSFVAVFAIAQILPVFLKPLTLWPNERMTLKERLERQAEELFWISWVCLVTTLPITVENFYIVTPLSLIANMIVVPLSFLIFFTGAVFFLTFWWVPKFLFFVPLLIKVMMQFFVASLFIVEDLPGAYFIVGKLAPILLGILIAGIIYFLWDKEIKGSLARAAIIYLFILNIFLIQSLSREFDKKFQMTALDVGQGDAIYFEFPDGGNLLMDAGKGGDGDRGRWVVAPFLKSKGLRTIDALVISHPQEDHIGGMLTVLDEFQVKNIFDAGSRYDTKTFKILREKIEKEKTVTFHAHRGAQIEGFRGVQIKALNPPEREVQDQNVNNECLVLKVIYKNTNFLLTGDIEEKAMSDILNSGEDVHAQVLKVPHHGSTLGAAGESFVKAVNPKISVISVGEKNKFHHPSEATLKILSAIPGNRIFRTDQDYAVEIMSDGNDILVVDNHAGW